MSRGEPGEWDQRAWRPTMKRHVPLENCVDRAAAASDGAFSWMTLTDALSIRDRVGRDRWCVRTRNSADPCHSCKTPTTSTTGEAKRGERGHLASSHSSRREIDSRWNRPSVTDSAPPRAQSQTGGTSMGESVSRSVFRLVVMRTTDLASAIVRYALDEPFRQSRPVSTRDFSKYLRDRGLHLGANVLTDLAIAGVLLPIAVDDSALADTQQERYRPVLLAGSGTVFADVGRPVLPEDVELRTTVRDPIPDMLWHPFQLGHVSSVARIVEGPRISPMQWLYPKEAFEALITRRYDLIDPRAGLARFTESDQAQEFHRVLAVLLAAEPLVAGATVGRLRLTGWPQQESLDGYYNWRDGFDPNALLRETGATVDLLRKWHRELADWAELSDPVGSWREVLRYAPRDKRLQFRGTCLVGRGRILRGGDSAALPGGIPRGERSSG